MSASGTSISDASPSLLRRVAVCNGILSFVGVFLALYAYLNFSHPAVILHSGKSTWTESVESYAFIFPIIQMTLFLVPLFYSVRWQTFLHRAIEQEDKYKATKPYMESMNSVLVYRGYSRFRSGGSRYDALSIDSARSLQCLDGNAER